MPDLPEPVSHDPALVRISDADRNRVAEVLREAAGDGRIDLEELDERLDRVFAAKTYRDLAPLTADLPSVSPLPPGSPGGLVVPGKERERSVAIMSGVDRRGVWVVPREYSILCLMGGANLDLRQAHFAAREVVITVHAIMGGADIVVNRSTHVIVEGTGIMGGFTGPASDAGVEINENSPVVRVRGIALMGGVNVRRRPMPGESSVPGWRRRH